MCRVRGHFFPLSNPADGTREGEQNRVHLCREAERVERNTGIEVDIGVQLFADEIFVFERDFLEFHSDLEKRLVALADNVQNFVTGLLHDFRARVVVLVDAVTKAHEAEWVVLVFGATNEFRDFIDGADFLEHVECCFVSAAMAWAPEACNAGCDTCEWVSTRRACETNSRRRRVLLVVSVKDEDLVHRLSEGFVHFIVLSRDRKTHTQEVLRIAEIVAR